jgi:hypothetical protein
MGEAGGAMAGGGMGGGAMKAMEKAPDWHAAHRTKRMTVPEMLQWGYIISKMTAQTRGRGGMNPAQREQARSEGTGSINSKLVEAQAQLSRASANNPGASGAAGEKQLDLNKQGMGAHLQNESKLRDADLRVRERNLAQIREQWNSMTDRRQKAKADSAKYLANDPSGADQVSAADAQNYGAMKRQKTAADVSQTATTAGV